MKRRLISAALAAIITLSLGFAYTLQVSAAKANISPVSEAMPAGNFFGQGAMDSADCLKYWSANKQNLTFIEGEGGGYLECSGLVQNHTGFTYTPPLTVSAGIYKFTGYLRMTYEGELTHLRLTFYETDKTSTEIHVYPTSDKWIKVETYLTFDSDLKNLKVCGGPNKDFLQSYCIDNFSMVRVSAIPEGVTPAMSFGTPVNAAQAVASNSGSIVEIPKWNESDESQYEVQGLVINQDADAFLASLASGGVTSVTEQQLKAYAMGFKGSHITDYMICVNNTNASFPSDTWTDVLDKYHQTEENGVTVNYKNEGVMKGAYRLYEEANLDYIDIWCKNFPEIGINPWLSFRMNDVHGHTSTTSHLLSDYYHANPQVRRVQHGSKSNTYYDNAQDYTHNLVREHMLVFINEALSRYDCYGIELDFQREIWLWYTGGEYNGLEILNGFMRKVDELVKTYETKYGHEIKIGVRCASDIQTNYDFGLDIVTWAAEDIIDMVSPCGRWSTTDNDVPVKTWKSVMAPFGVEVWPGIECNIIPSGMQNSKGHSFETYTAAAANYLSQKADKVYLFNYYRVYSTALTAEDRVSTTDAELASTLNIGSGKGYWNLITTLGSYDKVMKTNRRMILTYNDTKQLWANSNSQLPKTVSGGVAATVRIPMGDIPSGAEVTIKFGVSDVSVHTANPPKVFVNSKECAYKGNEACAGGYTDDTLLCYTIPVDAHNEMYAVAEIIPNESMTVTYAEIYIKAPVAAKY